MSLLLLLTGSWSRYWNCLAKLKELIFKAVGLCVGRPLTYPAIPSHLRYLFTLDLPEYWENKHADQTLEVLMSDLDPAIMDQFYMKDGVSASDVTHVRLQLANPALPHSSSLLFFLVLPVDCSHVWNQMDAGGAVWRGLYCCNLSSFLIRKCWKSLLVFFDGFKFPLPLTCVFFSPRWVEFVT